MIFIRSKTRLDFAWSGVSPVELEIRDLKERDFSSHKNLKPGKFYIHIEEQQWNHPLLQSFIDVFYHFKERSIVWETLSIRISSTNSSFTRPLIHLANSLNLFKKLQMVSQRFFDAGDNIFPQITTNNSLQGLDILIGSSTISENDSQTLINFLQTTQCLKELKLDLRVLANSHQERFCTNGLAKNKTLERLCVDSSKYEISDQGIADIISSVRNHPRLEELRIIAQNHQFGDSSSHAIKNLLISPSSTLTNLALTGASLAGGKLNLECIVEGLKNNESLKYLSIKNTFSTDDMFFSGIFLTLLSKLSYHLENICLLQTISQKDMEQVISMKRLPKPITLESGFAEVHRDKFRTMERVLRSHPEIRLTNFSTRIPHWRDKEYKDSGLGYIVALNWHGRYLQDTKSEVPSSLWPLVFEKVNNNHEIEKAVKTSVMFELLKGPAFAAK